MTAPTVPYDLVRMYVSGAPGTGSITFGAATPGGFITAAAAGIPNGTIVPYGIVDGNNRETGSATIGGTGTTATRTLRSSTTGSLLNLTSNAIWFIGVGAADLIAITNNFTSTTNATAYNAAAAVFAGGIGAAGGIWTNGYFTSNGGVLYMNAAQTKYLQWNGSNWYFTDQLIVNGNIQCTTLNSTSTTDATAIGSAAAVLSGGLSVALSMYVGGNVRHDTAFATASKIIFADSTNGQDMWIYRPASSRDLRIANGGGTDWLIIAQSNGNVAINSSTAATASNAAALVVNGGVGVTTLWSGGWITTSSGVLYVNSAQTVYMQYNGSRWIFSTGTFSLGGSGESDQISLGGYGAISGLTGNTMGYLTHQYASANGSDQLSLAGNFRRTDSNAGTVKNSGMATAEVLLSVGGGSSSIVLATTSTNNAAPTPRLTVNAAGDVAISSGTASSSYQAGALNVVGGIGTNTLWAGSWITTNSGVLYMNAAQSVYMQYDGTRFYFNSGNIVGGQDLYLGGATGAQSGRIEITYNGVTRNGIAFIDTSSSGTHYACVFLNNTTVAVGSIQVNTTSTYYATSSDARLKTKITDAISASEIIAAVKIRQFDWRADGSHQRFGVIAQEVRHVMPEVVTVGKTDDDMLGVDNSKFVPALIKAFQELRSEVIELRATRH